MNTVVLHGRLARDIDLRTTTTGKQVATCTIAVSRRGKDAGTDFIPIVVWGQQADTFARYLSKGREVALTGRLQVRNYTDNNNNKRYVTEVVVAEFDFCGSKGNSDGGGNNYGGNNYGGNGNPFGNAFGNSAPDEDIPF